MNMSARRYQGSPVQGPGAPSRSNFGPRKPRKENVRFGVNKGKSRKNNLVMDEHIQEATPEHLRIEIDKIFAEFLGDPEKTEYIFPPDLNNLQRKYIHYKAQNMNLVSRSHGKEPNRQLHLRKKPRQLSSQSFEVPICDEICDELREFDKKYGQVQSQPQNYRAVKRYEKVYGRLQDSEPVIPEPGKIDREIQQIRQNLPIYDKHMTVLETISKNQVVIISSETGSGKTTQIPQYILEDAYYRKKPCKIVCTQPRRISTIAAAERVAYERGDIVGGTVGFHIRLESKCGVNTNLLFCTVGVFLRNLMCGTDCLKQITHVIVDEIHERDKLSDFLLICLRQSLVHFPHLKVILMSATVDTTKFQEYFNSSAVLTIPGRLHPIQTYFLEDVLSMTQFFTPHMRAAMNKLQKKKDEFKNPEEGNKPELSEQDQANLNSALEAYMNFSEDYDYIIHYEEATADLLQLFISEDVPVDQQHSERGWTALMVACHLGDVEFIGKLCTLGASLDVSDKLGKTAYDYAKVANRNNILQLLDFIKEQKINENSVPNTNDSQYLQQLYDMTTPDDFIDYDLIVALIKYIHANSDTGSILIFLPGYDEIMRCNDHILDSDLNSSSYRIFFLHSSMNMKDQCDVFKRLPDQRKLILSTNIAETSITVEDVVFVVDIGKAKEKVYDSYNKLSALQTQWISRACAKQRQGRAGRVRPGFCFRLYSNQRYMHMPEERVPEILRVSLEELCLHAKIIAPKSMNIYNFLCLAPDPPTANSVGVAIENLQSLGALDKEEDLTRLGEYLAQLTLEPRLGKMLIYACIFKCLEPMLTLCAAMAHKDPFQLPPQANLKTLAAGKRRELIDGVPSDHAVYLLVFQRWQEEVMRGRSKQFCHDYFISESTMFSVLETRRQLLGQLRAVGFVNNTRSIDDFNNNCNSWGLVKAIMSSAYFPNVAYPVQRGGALATRNEKKVAIQNTSVCSSKRYEDWCFYDEMVKNRINFMVRGVTLCAPLTIALMCGVDTVYTSPLSVNIDDWLEFCFADPCVIKFRKAVQSLVDKSMSNPGHSFEKSNLIVSETLKKVMDMTEEEAEFVQPSNVGMRPKFLYKVIHENSSRRANREMTRDNMGQRPWSNSFNSDSASADWMELHKKGRTPKRFIPPNKKPLPTNSRVSRNLSFNQFNPGVSAITRNIQDFSVSAAPSSPSDILLRGLGATGIVSDNSYAQNSNLSRLNVPNPGGFSNNGFNSHSVGRGSYNQAAGYSSTYYNSGGPNSYLQYNSGYGRRSSNPDGGVLETISVETSQAACAMRRIVKQRDMTDFKYNDVFSQPPAAAAQVNFQNFFESGSLGILGVPTSTSVSPLQSIRPAITGCPSFDAVSLKTGISTTISTFSVIEKNPDYPDNPIFVVIRANEKRNIDIAQSCNKWVFSPQTEKKVLYLYNNGKIVYLVYFVKDVQMFMGIAEYKSLNFGRNFTKPTATIVWKYTSPLHKNKTKHLLNPYNLGKPIHESQDGVVIRQDVGEELMRIYAEIEGFRP